MPSPLLELLNVSCSVESGNVLFDDVNVKVYEGLSDFRLLGVTALSLVPGDILVLQGKSGGGKSTLLKCIGHLIAHDGHIVYRGRYPSHPTSSSSPLTDSGRLAIGHLYKLVCVFYDALHHWF
jgi:ABC-type lipoprotein export system ATPase subunit